LIEQLRSEAKKRNLPSAVITFRNHPQSVLRKDDVTRLLNTPEERLERLAETGVDYCFLTDFTENLSQMDAKTFICSVLKEKYNISLLLIGYDHRFGKNREEGFEEYQKYGSQCGIEVIMAKELPIDIHVSSTVIRRLLSEHRISEANRLLTYNYSLEGIVIQGNKLGGKIGFPTANLELKDKYKTIPGDGIYAVKVGIDGQSYGGMAYIGNRPTVDENGQRSIEVNIFDFSENIYGKTLKLEFVRFVREDQRFSGIEGLIEQLKKDKVHIMNILADK